MVIKKGDHVAVNLITQIKPHTPGVSREVIGCYILDEKTGLIHTFLSKMVVLATGGAGKIYRYTTNPDVATGDGVAMAYRAAAGSSATGIIALGGDMPPEIAESDQPLPPVLIGRGTREEWYTEEKLRKEKQ